MTKLQEVSLALLSDTFAAAVVNLAVIGQGSNPGDIAADYAQQAITTAPEEGTGQLVQRACGLIIASFG